MYSDFKLKSFHKLGTLIDNIINIGPNTKDDINFKPFM